MKQAIRYINETILREAKKLSYIVKDSAPSNDIDLFNAPSLVIWSGASDKTIFGDCTVNYAFRAIHDTLHIETGLQLNVESEIELGRIQANRCTSDLMAELTYIEVAGQALYFKEHGMFPVDQVSFTMARINKYLK